MSKIVKNCQNFGQVMFLYKEITLIKCLTVHRSLGSLFECQVVKSWVSKWMTRSHLLSCSAQLKKVHYWLRTWYYDSFGNAFPSIKEPLNHVHCMGYILFISGYWVSSLMCHNLIWKANCIFNKSLHSLYSLQIKR